MTINFKVPEIKELKPRILVLGVGGAGGNAINEMIDAGVDGVEFVAVNTDAQDLKTSKSKTRIQIGLNLTKGLGAGAKHEIGQAAADESLNDIVDILKGANMVFITAGMGGGTGTGAAHVIARAAKELNILTVGVVTLPFLYEAPSRMRRAQQGLEELRKHVDTIIVSTCFLSSSRPSCALRIRDGASYKNGRVTTPTVRIFNSLAALAITCAAPVPVPPPIPAVIKTMLAPLRISTISFKDSLAAAKPISCFAPAPKPFVKFKPI